LNDIFYYSAYVKITNVCSNILEPLPRNIIINFEAVVATFGFTALSACDSIMPQKSADLISVSAEAGAHGMYIAVQVFQHVTYQFLRGMSFYPTNTSPALI
jgi:NADPH-dependent curcumin reductase CurA